MVSINIDMNDYPNSLHPDEHTTGPQITWLGERLVAHGFGKHYTSGPGPHWSEADRQNVQDFQRAQGWTGSDADGYPGSVTLRLLAEDPAKKRKPTQRKAPKPKKPKVKESAAAKIVRIAHSQVGYHEGRSYGHWNNNQKYSPQVPGLEWSQNQPWCATFVSWCALKAGLADFYPRTASCQVAMDWWKSHNHWSEYPAVGAQVIYGGGVHTGLVYKFDDTYVYTIEGNTNTNGSAEGDGVYLKKRLRRDPYVTGYGYPQLPGGLVSADPNYYRSAS